MASEPQEELETGLECEKRGALADALAHYRRASDDAAAPPAVLAEALRRQAIVHHRQSNWESALECAQRAAEVAQAAELRDAYASSLNVTALVHQGRGDFASARRTLEEVLAIAEDDRVRGGALANLGSMAAQTGDWDLARRRFEQSRKCLQRARYLEGEAVALNNYGRAALDHGNFRLAVELLGEAVAVAGRYGFREAQELARLNYAEAIAGTGDAGRATELAREALAYFVAAGNTWRRVEALRVLGDLALQQARPAAAAAHYREALELSEQIGSAREAEMSRDRLRSVSTDEGRGAP